MKRAHHHFARLALFCLLAVAAAAPAFAQGTTSRVTGTVLDAGGAAVPAATVTLTNEATQVSFITETTSTGTYAFDSVQVGTYTVKVEKAGFKGFVSTDNVVNVNQPTTVDVSLEVGNVTEVVTVQASAELVQTSTSGNFGATIDSREITALPIIGTRGRNPLQLINNLPGVVVGSNTGGGVHVHGARDRAFNFTLDGIDINETSAGGSNFTPLRPNPDSISEMQVVTSNATAELGRSSGAQVSLVTRSGTNEFHGTLFEFYQTPRLRASEYEDNLNRIGKKQFVQHIFGGSVGGPVYLPKFGEGGDRVYSGKNRTFFFFNFQGLRTSETIGVTRTVYTADARAGRFRYFVPDPARPLVINGVTITRNTSALVDSNGNLVAGVRACTSAADVGCVATYNVAANDPARQGLDPTVQGLLNLTPLPNNFLLGGDGLNTARFVFAAPQREAQEDYAFKIDHNFNDSNAVFVRFAWGRQDTLCDNVNGGLQRFPNTPCVVDTVRRPRNLAVNYRRTFSPRATNELVVGYNRFIFSFDNPDPNAETNPPFILNTVTDPLSSSQRVYNARELKTYQLVDNFTYISGSHTYKAGVNFRYQQHIDDRSAIGSAGLTPSVDFSTSVNTVSVTAFNLPSNINTAFDRPLLQATINNLLGRIGNVSQSFVALNDQQYAPPGTRFLFDARYPEYDFYAQDTWKLRSNLTIDYGLRWEIRLSPRGGNGSRIFRPDRPVRLGEPPANNITFVEGKLYDDDWNNFGPSLGFAWDPWSDGKTSIRGNYRLAYDRTNTFVISSSIYQSVPGLTQTVLNQSFGQAGGRISQGVPQLQPPTAVTPAQLRTAAPYSTLAITTVDPSLSSPETHQWGASFQRDLGWKTVVELSYIGRKAHNLYGAYNVNQLDINNNGFLAAFNQLRAAFVANPNCFPTVRTGCSVAANTSPLINQLYSRDTRLNAGETGSQFVVRQLASSLALGGVASVAADIANRIQSGTPAYVAAGFSPSFFRPFTQFATWNVLDSNDYSTYNAFEAQLRRRFTGGTGFGLTYTLSKSMDTRSFDPAFTVVGTANAQSASSTPFDVRDRRLNYALSDFDRRHAVNGYFTHELPFGRGKRFWSDLPAGLDRLVGGFELTGTFYYFTGRPFTVYSGVNTLSNVNQSFANCDGCSPGMGRLFQEELANGRVTSFFDAEQRARFSTPAPGQLGNTGRNFFTGPPRFNMDMVLIKRTRFTETQNLELRVEAQNLTNTASFGFPTATITSTTFGVINDAVISGSRRIQLGVKYNF